MNDFREKIPPMLIGEELKNALICLPEYDPQICKEDRRIISYDMNKYQFLRKAQEGKVKSYVQDTAIAVYDSMQESSSKEEFISAMNNKGYTVDWQDSHKYIVFTNAEGKKVRDRNLKKTYNIDVGKDELITLFKEKSLQKESPSRHRRR